MLALERIHAKHQPRHPVVFVDLSHALGEFHRLVDVAINQKRQESAIEQLAIVRVALECGAIISGGRSRIALLTRVTRGKIAAGGADSAKLHRAPCLRGCEMG